MQHIKQTIKRSFAYLTAKEIAQISNQIIGKEKRAVFLLVLLTNNSKFKKKIQKIIETMQPKRHQ